MCRCSVCKYAVHDQFKGHCGRWMCLHPYRKEISNKGDFTYPANHNPHITICETAASDYDNPVKQKETLKAAETPVWCYFEVVERATKANPRFNPDRQRAILWPSGRKF